MRWYRAIILFLTEGLLVRILHRFSRIEYHQRSPILKGWNINSLVHRTGLWWMKWIRRGVHGLSNDSKLIDEYGKQAYEMYKKSNHQRFDWAQHEWFDFLKPERDRVTLSSTNVYCKSASTFISIFNFNPGRLQSCWGIRWNVLWTHGWSRRGCCIPQRRRSLRCCLISRS